MPHLISLLSDCSVQRLEVKWFSGSFAHFPHSMSTGRQCCGLRLKPILSILGPKNLSKLKQCDDIAEAKDGDRHCGPQHRVIGAARWQQKKKFDDISLFYLQYYKTRKIITLTPAKILE
jgi:hypothetical protein